MCPKEKFVDITTINSVNYYENSYILSPLKIYIFSPEAKDFSFEMGREVRKTNQ